jgi:nucleotide-binding universal stress UspA family protein
MDFKQIVVTTDLSENAEVAMPVAASLARRFDGHVDVVHVFEVPLYAFTEGVPMALPEWTATVRQNHLRKLGDYVREFAGREKIDARPVLLEGETTREILRYATEVKADCIVIATHGRTGLQRLLLGSVAEKIVRLSPCPVLAVPAKGRVPFTNEQQKIH